MIAKVAKRQGIMSATDLACYIENYYNKKYGEKEMSGIVLQKSLYFLFAFWGGFVRQGNMDKNPETSDLLEILFPDKIEAWTYGPVIPDVYYTYKNGLLDDYKDNQYQGDDKLFEGKELLHSTIDSLLDDIFKISPFKLVTISHRDEAWKTNYDGEISHHNEITPEEIISEYASR